MIGNERNAFARSSSSGNLVSRFLPLRDVNVTDRSAPTVASARKPSHLISKSQSGSSNAASVAVASWGAEIMGSLTLLTRGFELLFFWGLIHFLTPWV